MHKIHVDLGADSYDIVVANGAIRKLAEFLRPLVAPSRILIISNSTVFGLYGDTIREALIPLGCEISADLVEDGEQYKNLATIEHLLDGMVKARLDRKSVVVALGGGVVGDMAGFAASIFMRGVPYVQAPTTLLAQVDSSIGGKVGVDHVSGKNLIGSFHQPLLVCTDPALLSTLSARDYRNGLSEVIKYGVIADEGLFSLLERHIGVLCERGDGVLTDIIKRCCQIKARIIQQDVREITGLRSILNYGHTIGHAVESVTGYTRYSHGEAVSIGMVAAARIAGILNLVPQGVEQRQEHLLESVGLPVKAEGVAMDRVVDAMQLDKKASGGKLKFVVPISIGRGVIRENVPAEVVERALAEIGAK
ncbi:MAG: 3-dehydroquinate synthase [Candidatus Abyssobacteria bacterium SURF_5]|uniref:3-dehydroquinate synthase n=1 Tax=Abyssobacteria bacterium (strain SURF_5) TaxID=2093360 RepID=A0A3A4NIJ0_ABYX5|nr:MAG: 3-dehydroquinate synthase [Candidatus Abyssubacteria bacterium SURF_5]